MIIDHHPTNKQSLLTIINHHLTIYYHHLSPSITYQLISQTVPPGVPLAVVPIFGDQPANADVVASTGAGVSFRFPQETLTVPALKEAVHKLLYEDSNSDIQLAVKKLQKELQSAGGVSKAADLVMASAARSSKLRGA